MRFWAGLQWRLHLLDERAWRSRVWMLALLLGLAAVGDLSAARAQGLQNRAAAPVVVMVRPGQSPEEIAKLVAGLAGRNVAVEVQVSDGTAVERQHGSREPGAIGTASMLDLPALIMEGWNASLAHVADLPALLGDIQVRALGLRKNGIDLKTVFGAAASLALALAAGALVVAGSARRPVDGAPPVARPFVTRLRYAVLRAATEVAAIGVVYLIAFGATRLLYPNNDAVREFLRWFLRGAGILAVYWIVARFLLDPTGAGPRLLPIEPVARNRRFFMGYAWLVVTLFWWLAPLLKGNASDPASFLGYLTLTGTLANIYKLVWFWVTRHDIARLILSASDARGRVSFVTRGLSVLVPAVSIALPIGLWFTIIISSVSVLSEQISTAAGLTQVLFFVVPILAAGAYAVVWSLMEEAGELSAGGAASRAALSALAGAAIAAGGLLILQNTWDFALAMQAPQAVAGVHAVVAAAVVLLAGWVVLQYLKAFFEAHAPRRAVNRPGEEDDSDAAPLTRMATALPLIRNVALATVAAIAGLVALAKLGLDTAPLLAGAGIVGLGISFGSQALVRDIMSGIFFMGDDAFRIGEYIDTGKLKGHVERITLRSVQLRHQNGQIHTIPYGQIASVTNFSRDWSTIKFNLRLERGTDIETVRKLIKRVGRELLEDEEIGGDFLLPVKLQGVSDIIENAIILRVKFTAKPGRPTYVQRIVLRRIYAALTDAGVEFARNAVVVREHNDGSRMAGAAGSLLPPAADAI